MNRKCLIYLRAAIFFFVLSGTFGLLGNILKSPGFKVWFGILMSAGIMAGLYCLAWGIWEDPKRVKARSASIMFGGLFFYVVSVMLSQGLIQGTAVFGMNPITPIVRPFKKTASSLGLLLTSSKDLIRKGADEKTEATTDQANTEKSEFSYGYMIWLIGFGIAAWKWIRSFSWYSIISTITLTGSIIFTIRIWKNFQDTLTISMIVVTIIILCTAAYCIWKFNKDPVVA